MSTTFGVRMENIPNMTVHNELYNKPLPIARRMGIGKGKVRVWFTKEWAKNLPRDTEVEAIDNSNQGINTIGDLLDAETK